MCQPRQPAEPAEPAGREQGPLVIPKYAPGPSLTTGGPLRPDRRAGPGEPGRLSPWRAWCYCRRQPARV